MSRFSMVLAAGCAAAALLAATPALASPFSLARTLNNPTPLPSEWFGRSVAVSGNVGLAGAPSNVGVPGAGAAYLFDVSTGGILHRLAEPTLEVNAAFGYAVSVSGNSALVGAPGATVGGQMTGAAFLFDVNTGGLTQTFQSPAPAADDGFGFSVAISGNLALIGTPFDDDTSGIDSGTAYLFDVITGNLLHTFASPAPHAIGEFGSSVALSANMALVGSPRDNTGAPLAGAAFLFDVKTGGLLHTLVNPDPASFDLFGISVSMSDGKALVGAPSDDTGGFNAGAAYLFDVGTGGLIQTLQRPEPAPNTRFGRSVSLSGDSAIIGSIRDISGTISSGSAYLFDATSGQMKQAIDSPGRPAEDEFGFAVAISGNAALVGAHGTDLGTTDAGAAYIFIAPGIWDSPVSGEWDEAANWEFDADPAGFDATTDIVIAPAASLIVTGPAGRATANSVTVGGGAGGTTVLSLNGGSITADDGVTVESNGVLNGQGVVGANVTNHGEIGGSVTIFDFVANHTSGLMDVTAGDLLRAETVLNLGEIRNTGGELQISYGILNQTGGNVSGVNATFDFGSLGVGNAGSMTFEGFNTVAGDVLNVAGGKIINSRDGTLEFYDNVTNNGELQTSGSTTIFGDYTGSGSLTGRGTLFLEGDFSPGSSPALIQATVNIDLSNAGTTTMELEGLLRGVQYDALDAAQTLTLGGDLEIVYLGGFEALVGDTFLLFTAAEILGSFDSIVFAAVQKGQWVVHQTATTFSVTVEPLTAPLEPVPIPAMAWPFAGLILAAGWMARRKAG